jgi:DNA polymerase type B, organellar and viral.
VSCWAYSIAVAPQYKHLFEDYPGHQGKPFKQMRSMVGHNIMSVFFEALLSDVECMHDIVKGDLGNVPMSPPEDDPAMVKAKREATVCRFCHQPLPELDPETGDQLIPDVAQTRVLDHDHFTGEYRGTAHAQCNIRASLKKNYLVPVVFHNLKGYDGYHLLRAMGEDSCKDLIQKMDVIAKSMEKFTSITLNNKLRFIDSLQFMLGSLDSLTRNLSNSLKSMEEKKEAFGPFLVWDKYTDNGSAFRSEEEYFKFFTKKGVYPYELATKVDDLFAASHLPSLPDFRSRLRGGDISEGEYRRALKAWEFFKCETMADYTAAYCECDVLQLRCVGEAFRKAALVPGGHGIDPFHCVTAPGMAWAAMTLRLLRTGVNIDCFTQDDVGMDGFLMAEGGVRGGMCQVFHPYAYGTGEPNTEEEVEERPLYIDANNLYGDAMSQHLPMGEYKWMKQLGAAPITLEERKLLMEATLAAENPGQQGDRYIWSDLSVEIRNWDEELAWVDPDMRNLTERILNVEDDADYGYLLEVDLDYPQHLHDLHNDFPFCPENKLPPNPSPYSRTQFKEHGQLEQAFKTRKLIMDLTDKKNYIVHYRLLKMALRHGLVLKNVHRVMRFKQGAWLKPYIDFNTNMRKGAKNDIDKDFWKLLSNSIFGKLCENLRSRRNVQFILREQWARAVKFASHPWIKGWRVIVPDRMICMETARTKVVLDRPIIVGQAILDISKCRMYGMWYDVLKPHFGDRIRSNYSDTDSLVMMIQSLPGKTVNYDLRLLQDKYNIWDLSEIQNPGQNELTAGMTKEQIMANAKKLGCFKDEMFGIPIKEAVFLRPKMYSIWLTREIEMKHHNPKKAVMGKKQLKVEISKRKGLPKHVPKEQERLFFSHESYRKVYFGTKGNKISFPTLNHTKTLGLFTGIVTKKGLQALDDKSFWFNAATCLRYGHYWIETYLSEYNQHKEAEQWADKALATVQDEGDYERSEEQKLLDEAIFIHEFNTLPQWQVCEPDPGMELDPADEILWDRVEEMLSED